MFTSKNRSRLAGVMLATVSALTLISTSSAAMSFGRGGGMPFGHSAMGRMPMGGEGARHFSQMGAMPRAHGSGLMARGGRERVGATRNIGARTGKSDKAVSERRGKEESRTVQSGRTAPVNADRKLVDIRQTADRPFDRRGGTLVATQTDTYFHPRTGQTVDVPQGHEPPLGWRKLHPDEPWHPYGGTVSYIPGMEPRNYVDPNTGETQWIYSGEEAPRGWIPLLPGTSVSTTPSDPYFDPRTGQMARVPQGQEPPAGLRKLNPDEPWHPYGGTVSYIPGMEPRNYVNPNTGETRWIYSGKDAPRGWVPLRPAMGEYARNDVPMMPQQPNSNGLGAGPGNGNAQGGPDKGPNPPDGSLKQSRAPGLADQLPHTQERPGTGTQPAQAAQPEPQPQPQKAHLEPNTQGDDDWVLQQRRQARELAREREIESLPPDQRPVFVPPVSLSTQPVEETKVNAGPPQISRGLRDYLDDYATVYRLLTQARADNDMRAIFQLEAMENELVYIIGLYTNQGAQAVNNYLAEESRRVLYEMIKVTASSGNIAIGATSTAVNNALPNGTNPQMPTRLNRTPAQVRALIKALVQQAKGGDGPPPAAPGNGMTPPRTPRNPDLMRGGVREALPGKNPDLSEGGVRPALQTEPVVPQAEPVAPPVQPNASGVVTRANSPARYIVEQLGEDGRPYARAYEIAERELGNDVHGIAGSVATNPGRVRIGPWPVSTGGTAMALDKLPLVDEELAKSIGDEFYRLWRLKRSTTLPSDLDIPVTTQDSARLDAVRDLIFQETGVLVEFVPD